MISRTDLHIITQALAEGRIPRTPTRDDHGRLAA